MTKNREGDKVTNTNLIKIRCTKGSGVDKHSSFPFISAMFPSITITFRDALWRVMSLDQFGKLSHASAIMKQ